MNQATRRLIEAACIIFLLISNSACTTVAPNYGCFPTDDGELIYFDAKRGKEILRHEKVEASRFRPECQPPDRDYNGHWGIPVDGLQVSIRLERVCFAVGEPIPIALFIRNVSKKVQSYDHLVPDKNLIIELRKNGEIISPRKESNKRSFEGKVTRLVQQSHRQYIIAHTQRKFTYQLLDQYDLSSPGHYAVRFGRSVLNREDEAGTNVMSGWAQFDISTN